MKKCSLTRYTRTSSRILFKMSFLLKFQKYVILNFDFVNRSVQVNFTRRLPAVALVIFIPYVMPTNNDIPFRIQKFGDERGSQSFPVFCPCFTLCAKDR